MDVPVVKTPRVYGCTVVKGSPHRGISPERQRPAKARRTGKKGWVPPIERVLDRLDRAIDNPLHALYRELQMARGSEQLIRSEGRKNLHSALHALVTNSEVGQWLVANKQKNHRRYKVSELDERAFGKPIPMERSPKRTWRAMKLCRTSKILRVDRIAETTKRGRIREVVAIRHLTRHFFKLLGLEYLCTAAARDADRESGRALVATLANLPNSSEPAPPALILDDALPTTTGPYAIDPPQRPPRPPDLPAAAHSAYDAFEEIYRDVR